MLIGAMVLALGYAMLWIPTKTPTSCTVALGVIIVGNGLFKPNAGNLVRKIYEGDDTKIDSAFTIYYMAVNIGSTISMLLTPWIRDYVGATLRRRLGWHTAFGVCCDRPGPRPDQLLADAPHAAAHRLASRTTSRSTSSGSAWCSLAAIGMVFVSAFILQNEAVARVCVYAAGVVMLGIFVAPDPQQRAHERAGLIAALVLMVQTIFFFIFYQQMSTSLNLFAQRNVDLSFDLFGMHLFNWIPGAVPVAQRDLDRAAEPGAGARLQRAWARSARTRRWPPSSRWASPRWRSASSSTASARTSR